MWLDWGNLTTNLYYPSTDPATGSVTTQYAFLYPQQTSPGWRQWTIAFLPSGLQVQIDGTTVFTGPASFAFDIVSLSECCIAGTAVFDDFSFTPAPPAYSATLT